LVAETETHKQEFVGASKTQGMASSGLKG